MQQLNLVFIFLSYYVISGDKKTFYLDSSTFLTGVNTIEKGPKRIDEDLPKGPEINFYHTELNKCVTVIY